MLPLRSHMKKALLTLLFLNFACLVFAQQNIVSLKHQLDTAKTNNTKVLLLAKLAHAYSNYKPDTSYMLAQQGLKLAKKINFLRGEARCYKETGEAQEQMGDYPGAMNAYLNQLKTAQQLNDQFNIGQALINIGFLYQDQDEYRSAIDNTLKANTVLEAIAGKNKTRDFDLTENVVLLNIGYYYYKLNKLDSALFFEQNAYELAMAIHNDDNMGNILQNLGLIQEKYGNKTLAITYYRMSAQKSLSTGRLTTLTDTYLRIADYYKEASPIDSCVYYASKALGSAKAALYIKGVLESSTILSDFYSTKDATLAYTYLKTATAAKDSLFSEEKVKQVQNLKFAEEAREREIAELKTQQAEERKNTLQLSAIALFIPVFFLVSLLLSKIKIHNRIIEFMSVLSILFLFEFFTLLIHPIVNAITNDTPIIEFLVFVCLAGVMVPAHHHLTLWLKHRLTSAEKWIMHEKKPVSTEKPINAE